MKKKRPITTSWWVKLVLIVFIGAVIYLTVKSFMAGLKEGRQKRLQESLEK